jgi:hypothetical protein
MARHFSPDMLELNPQETIELGDCLAMVNVAATRYPWVAPGKRLGPFLNGGPSPIA